MVFRKENKVDAFQRQISALRQQLGTDGGEEEPSDAEASYSPAPEEDARPDVDQEFEVDPSPSGPGFGTREAAGFAFGSSSAASVSAYGSVEAEPQGEALPAIAAPGVDARTSVVAHDAVWNGDLNSTGSIHVHGRVEGSITAQHDVYIAEEAEVAAVIAAANVVIAGSVRGSVRCSARFEVLPQGRIAGEVLSPTLIVHEGATVTAQFRMGSGDGPSAAPTPPAPPAPRRGARGET